LLTKKKIRFKPKLQNGQILSSNVVMNGTSAVSGVEARTYEQPDSSTWQNIDSDYVEMNLVQIMKNNDGMFLICRVL